MFIIGELINTSRKRVEAIVRRRDERSIQQLACAQVEAGACALDVNAGTIIEEEAETLEWLVKTVQQAVQVPLCIDTVNPDAMDRALAAHRGRAILNSIDNTPGRSERLLAIIRNYRPRVIALCFSEDQLISDSATVRLSIARELVERLVQAGLEPSGIYVDPLVRPLSIGSTFGALVLDTLMEIKEKIPDVQTVLALSNISFGLPQRRLVNQSFLPMSMMAGLDAVLLDPLDHRLMGVLKACRAILGEDEYCLEYIDATRAMAGLGY